MRFQYGFVYGIGSSSENATFFQSCALRGERATSAANDFSNASANDLGSHLPPLAVLRPVSKPTLASRLMRGDN